jgi:ABC-type Fe3+ transport system permease subunit
MSSNANPYLHPQDLNPPAAVDAAAIRMALWAGAVVLTGLLMSGPIGLLLVSRLARDARRQRCDECGWRRPDRLASPLGPDPAGLGAFGLWNLVILVILVMVVSLLVALLERH